MTESYFGTLKRHGVKLSIALFLGYLLYMTITYLVAFLLMIPVILIGAAASGPDADQIAESLFSEPGGIVFGAVFLLLLFLASTLAESFFTAGAYGAASAGVFRGESSIGSFFSEGLKNLWKMFGQQILLRLFFMVPLLVVILSFGLLAETGEPSPIASFLMILIVVGYLWVFMHAPLLLTVERRGVWDSIRLAFGLIIKKPGQTLLSGLIALAIILGTLLLTVFVLVVLPAISVALTGGNGAVGVILSILGVLCFLFALPYAFSAALLVIVHRYKTRLRSFLFPEEPDREEGIVGAAPGSLGEDLHDS
ncbi:MAG: hypothetical protein AB2404_01980 [Planifilum fimeticola]